MPDNKHLRETNLNQEFKISDIEKGITNCWGIVDEIKLLNEAVQEKKSRYR